MGKVLQIKNILHLEHMPEKHPSLTLFTIITDSTLQRDEEAKFFLEFQFL